MTPTTYTLNNCIQASYPAIDIDALYQSDVTLVRIENIDPDIFHIPGVHHLHHVGCWVTITCQHICRELEKGGKLLGRGRENQPKKKKKSTTKKATKL